MIKSIHIYLSYFENESRILKETKSLIEHNIIDQIKIVGLWKVGLLENEQIDSNRTVWRIKRLSQKLPHFRIISPLKYLEIIIRAFFFIRSERPNFLNIHEVSLVPLVFFVRLFMRKTKIIYDTHELETETNRLRGVTKLIIKILERWSIKLFDYTFVVSPSIEAWYRSTYKLNKISTIRNCPNTVPTIFSSKLRDKLNISEKSLIFLYQGGLSFGRGIENIIQAFQKINDLNFSVVFMGYGEHENFVKEQAAKCENIYFHPAVPPEELLAYTASADVGLSIIENSCLSYYYCLPNKIYEYLMAEIPSIVSDLPEMAEFVKKNGIGVVVQTSSVEGIIMAVSSFSRGNIDNFKSNIGNIKHLYSWENEEKKMIDIYKSL